MQKKWHIIANEYVVSLFPVFMSPNSLANGIKKTVGKTTGEFAIKLENNSVTYLYLPELWKKAHLYFVNKIKKDYKVLSGIFQRIKESSQALVSFTTNLQVKKLNLSSVRELNHYIKNIAY